MAAPVVVSVSPANNDTDVILGTQITVTFDQQIDPATVSDRRGHGRNLQARLGLRVLPPTTRLAHAGTKGTALDPDNLPSERPGRGWLTMAWFSPGSMALVFVPVLCLLLLPAL